MGGIAFQLTGTQRIEKIIHYPLNNYPFILIFTNMIAFQPFPDLSTERLLLRQMTMEDDKEVFALRSDDSVLEFTGIKKATEIEDARQFIQMINNNIERNESIFWALSLKNDPQLIGTICIWNINFENAVAEIGYMLLPAMQGKGLMQEAFVKTVEFGFEEMKLMRIDAEVHPGNLASIKILERNGFSITERSPEILIYSLQKEKK